MDFNKQLQNLARAANSNSRESQDGGSSRNYNDNRNNDSRNRYSRGGGGRGSDHYRNHNSNRHHPYNNSHRRRNHQYRGGGDQQQLTPSEEEFYLSKLIQEIPKYKPLVTRKSNKRHVALLFLTIDDLPFEHLWRAFLNNYKPEEGEKSDNSASTSDHASATATADDKAESVSNDETITFETSTLLVSVLCHAKYPDRVRSPWLQRRLLVSNPPARNRNHSNNKNNNRSNNYDSRNSHYSRGSSGGDNYRQNNPVRYHTRRPEWGSVNITRAMIDLLVEALKIGTPRDKTMNQNQHDDRYSTSRYISSMHSNHDERKDGNSMKGALISPGMLSSSSLANDKKIPFVDRFVFLSESCLPVVTLKEFEMSLFGLDEPDSDPFQNRGAAMSMNMIRSQQQQQQQRHHSTDSQNEKQGQKTHSHYTGEIANKSWVKAYNKPNNGYARQLQWDAIKSAVPKNCIYKADQWILLTRHHGWPLIDLIDEAEKKIQQNFLKNDFHHKSNIKVNLWQCFGNVKASDEMYFPTAMALLGMFGNDDDGSDDNDVCGSATRTEITDRDEETESSNSIKNEIASKRVTYCDWSMNAKNPASFIINKQDDPQFKELKKIVKLARDEGCLFARKFSTGYNVTTSNTISVIEWTKIIRDAIKGTT